MYDHGARNRNPVSTLWYGNDPLFEKYPEVSPFLYCAQRPISFVDLDGQDSLAVLNAPDGAGGMGHMAILIQDKNKKWRLWSKNGTDEKLGTYGPTPGEGSQSDKAPNVGDGNPMTLEGFESVQEFLNSDLNPIKKETGKRTYQEAYALETTYEQNRAAEQVMKKELVGKNSNYNVLGDNCAKSVQKSLDAAGKVGTRLVNNDNIFYKISLKVPKVIYHEIKVKNKGGKVFTP